MIKTAMIASAVLFGAAAPTAQFTDADPTPAEHVIFNLPAADVVVAQFSYLELSHGAEGFGVSVTDETAVFVDFEFPGNLHIRVGF